MTSFIPESAPFNEQQRAWLNGFFAGLTGLRDGNDPAVSAIIGQVLTPAAGVAVATPDPPQPDDHPWHDAGLPIVDRMRLAEGKPLPQRLMAAMAQLDCGTCGYVCQTYGEALAAGTETNLNLCSPGGKPTKQMLKTLLTEASSLSGQVAVNGHAHAVAVPPTATSPTATSPAATSQAATSPAATTSIAWSRQNPFTARLVESRPLNLPGSAKDTRHVAIDLTGSGIRYEVGDALGIYPRNCDELTAKIIDRLAVDPNVKVQARDGSLKPLCDALCQDYCLKDPGDDLLELLVSRAASTDVRDTLTRMIDDGVPDGWDVLDVLDVCKVDGGVTITATEFVETLAPIQPRLYSIASSMKRVGDAVHLTVGKVTYDRQGRLRKGAASTMLADRVAPGDDVRVFVHANHTGFTVPADPDAPMIMVGPGTGIAPFMAFLQERQAASAAGENWLFFGDQREAFDFLYRDELQSMHRDGLLTRLDTAFSRDGETKVYVQDRMRQHAAELFRWIQRGAYFFVCGDASRMAADVDAELVNIVSQQAGMSAADAKAFVKQLAAQKRYVRDVY